MPKKLVAVSMGGVGDLLVAIPTYKALREKYPKCKLIIFCINKSHHTIVKRMPYVDSARLLGFWSLVRYPFYFYCYYFNREFIEHTIMQFQHIPLSWAYNKSVREIIPEIFDMELKSPKIELFFTEKEETEAKKAISQYEYSIIMHIYSRSSPNHHWPMANWVELVKQLPQFTFIQVGHSDEPYVTGAIDWRGKTKMMEAFCLLKHATSFVGVDSSFSHATNAFDIPGVVLFGDSSPVHWGHENNINIYKGLSCSPCYYDLWGGACPYGNECMHLISVEEVKMAILKQINSRKKEIVNPDDRHC
jgi:ADP-heptose:LPS heptosyltransferase